MKQLLLTNAFVWMAASGLLSQPASTPLNDVATQKFSFPATLYADSVSFEKTMPSLAQYILTGYEEKNKRKYFDNAAIYHLLAGDYAKVIAFTDSVQAMDDDASYGIDVKSYALAKMRSSGEAASFSDNFKREFTNEFNPLSFRKKVYMAFLDSSQVAGVRSDYWSFKEKLRAAKADSLSAGEAKELAEKYTWDKIYAEAFPLMSPVLSAPQYRGMYPVIKSYKWGSVVPVQGIDEKADPTMQYKLLMELTGFAYKGQDSTAKKEINAGLGEVARLINLHDAAGIPRKNMNVVVVVHASALNAFLTNEKYKKKYGIGNPNIDIIKELQHYGARIIVCGQAMTFFRLEKEELVPGIKQALTAQTVLSTYQLKNYVYYDLSLRE